MSSQEASGISAEPATRSRTIVALLLGALVAVWHFAHFEPATQPLVSDVRYYLYFAMRTVAGDVPHLDLFDNKTQLATFLGALLFRLGESCGLDPLLTIRWGYLGLAALGALLLFQVLRGLSGGSLVAGLLAVLSVASFGLLGTLPAIGNVAKLAMMVCGTAMALCTWRGRWLAAGAFGALAFWDWQVGGVAWAAALVTALLTAEARGRAAGRVVLGGALGCAPFLLYYGAHGALGACFDQTIVASFFRGTSAMDKGGFAERWGRIVHLVEASSPGRVWLVATSLLGALAALLAIWRWRRDERLRLLLPLTMLHLAVLAFSAIDFQWNGDLFAVLHGLAFFQALLWAAGWWGLESLTRTRAGARLAAAAAWIALAVWCTRPGALRVPFELETPLVRSGVTLADQLEVAERLRPRFETEGFVLAEFSELLFLLRVKNPTPFIYWNDATWSRFRTSIDEDKDATLARLIREREPDFFAYKKKLPRSALGVAYPFESIASESGRYVVHLQVRRGG